MRLLYYKFLLALKDCKYITQSKNVICSRNIKTGSYMFWYMDKLHLTLFDSCKDKDRAKFKLNVLI